MPGFLSFMGLALLLGLKHSYDADHILAVSHFLRKAHSLGSALGMSVNWAAGHMIMAGIVTTLLYTFRQSILSTLLAHFDKIIGIMLIGLGLLGLKDLFAHSHAHSHGAARHAHAHSHQSKSHVHPHMFGIGILHGLASNDEMLILFTASLGLSSLPGILMGVGVFSIGVVTGMVMFSLIFSNAMNSTSNNGYRWVTILTGTSSIGYGLLLLAK